MNVLVYFIVASSFTHCISSATVLKEDVDVLTLIDAQINLDLHSNLMQKIRRLYHDDFWLNISKNEMNCSQELMQFWGNLDNEKRAAYLDSSGKIGAGILTGNVVYLGYYDQCIDIGNTDYCLFPFDMTLVTNATITSNVSTTMLFEFGMCFPSSCDAKNFYNLFFIGLSKVIYSESFTNAIGVTYTIDIMAPTENRELSCPWRDLKWTNSFISVLVVCVMLIVFVIIGTIADVLLWFITDIYPKSHIPTEEPPETTAYLSSSQCEVKHSINEGDDHVHEPLIKAKPKESHDQNAGNYKKQRIKFIKDLFLSFSLYKTVPAIMSTQQSSNAIASINGIRVISMFWVILGHVYSFQQSQNVVANVGELTETVDNRFLFQMVVNYTFSVDSFFVLSGLLLSYLCFKDMDRRQGKFPFLYFYIHRFLRLSPGYFLAVFISFKMLPHIGSGPLWLLPSVDNCKKYWWTSILYISNFYPVSINDVCLTWYLSDIMQFFIISPIFLLLLYYFWKIGLVTIGGTMLASIGILGTLAGIPNYKANLYQGAEAGDSTMATIYEKPYCRINAYLIGIILGLVLHKMWRVTFINLWIRICFYGIIWVIAIGCCLIIVFGEYKTWQGHPFSKAENVMYFMFSRTVFSIGIALMIYACHNGFGGIINKFLSCSYWIPLSHLTYMAYLFNTIVITLMYNTMRFRFIYTDWFLIILFTAAVILTYSVAFIVAVTVEYPIANVENAVYKFTGMKRGK